MYSYKDCQFFTKTMAECEKMSRSPFYQNVLLRCCDGTVKTSTVLLSITAPAIYSLLLQTQPERDIYEVLMPDGRVGSLEKMTMLNVAVEDEREEDDTDMLEEEDFGEEASGDHLEKDVKSESDGEDSKPVSTKNEPENGPSAAPNQDESVSKAKKAPIHKRKLSEKTKRRSYDSHSGIAAKCDQCGKFYKSKASLHMHVKRIHDSDAHVFKCNDCDKRFSCKSVLDLHTRKHTGQKPFVCNECGQSFTQEGGLRTHERVIHQQERNFVCSQCGQKFGRKKDLSKHEETHKSAQERETLPCPECEEKFFHSYQLQAHKESVHLGLKIPCEKCGAILTSHMSYGQHTRNLHSDKLIYCAPCDITFSKRANLTNHNRRKHNIRVGKGRVQEAATKALFNEDVHK